MTSGFFLVGLSNVDADRATARKGIESEHPGMREIELHICRPMHRRKSRLAILSLDEFDLPGGDAQALGKEPPQARAGYDIVQPMLGVAEFFCAFPLVARQYLPKRSTIFRRRIKAGAYDIDHMGLKHAERL